LADGGKCLVEEEKQISGANKILKIGINIIFFKYFNNFLKNNHYNI